MSMFYNDNTWYIIYLEQGWPSIAQHNSSIEGCNNIYGQGNYCYCKFVFYLTLYIAGCWKKWYQGSFCQPGNKLPLWEISGKLEEGGR